MSCSRAWTGRACGGGFSGIGWLSQCGLYPAQVRGMRGPAVACSIRGCVGPDPKVSRDSPGASAARPTVLGVPPVCGPPSPLCPPNRVPALQARSHGYQKRRDSPGAAQREFEHGSVSLRRLCVPSAQDAPPWALRVPWSPEPGQRGHGSWGGHGHSLGATCQGSVRLALGVSAGGPGGADAWHSGRERAVQPGAGSKTTSRLCPSAA